MPFYTIDLCAGIGGIRRGFERTGHFENVAAAEIDPFACLTYQHLYGEDAYQDVTSKEFKAKLEHIDYDVLLAGFPCQTFSQAGLEKGFNDEEKGIIFYHITRIIRRTRPRAVFLENVENLVRHNKGQTFHVIINILERKLNYKVIGVTNEKYKQLKYNAGDFIRNSRFFGIPQNRPRTYILAFDRERYGAETLLGLKNTLPKNNDLCLYKDLNGLLEMKAEPKYYLGAGYLETLEKHKKREHEKGHGFGYKIVNAPEIEHPIASTITATGGSGRERNLVYDPQEGIAGKIIATKKTPLNNKGIRVMTPREWGKLQGFIDYAFCDEGEADHFSFPEGVTELQQYKQFGNAVTIPVIETMANFMLDCFCLLGDSPNGR